MPCTAKISSHCINSVMAALFGAAAIIATPAHANTERNDSAATGADTLEIVTTALGIGNLKSHSANQNALGIGLGRRLGIEASYYPRGESKHAVRAGGESHEQDNVGGRMDVKVALDVSAPLTRATRLFSRMGMYYWDIDLNYSRMTSDLDASQAGNSRVLSFGAAYDARDVRVSLELEQVTPDTNLVQRDVNRMLFNISSKF